MEDVNGGGTREGIRAIAMDKATGLVVLGCDGRRSTLGHGPKSLGDGLVK